MVYFSESELQGYGGAVTAAGATDTLTKSARSAYGTYDVFLSHSVKDARVVLGVKKMLEARGLTVYVDWIDDKDLDREHVSAETADRLRLRMKNSRSLIYATSRAASKSRWMPWELGYFDGKMGSGRISILPIDSARATEFVGQEYLGLYKTLEKILDHGRHLPYVVDDKEHRAETLDSFTKGRGQFVGLEYR